MKFDSPKINSVRYLAEYFYFPKKFVWFALLSGFCRINVKTGIDKGIFITF